MLLRVMRKFLLLLGAVAGLVAVPLHLKAASLQGDGSAAAWREVASETDRLRLRSWRTTWVEGLQAARSGHADEIAAQGALLEPDAALLDPAPPAGNYRCRTVKLGGRDLAYVAYPTYSCRIVADGATLRFTKRDGSQRPIGHIYPAGARRMIFLGSLQLGDERQVLPYGTDSRRDMAGIVERVGARRWRLVFPRPAFESIIDVIELVPA